MEQKYSFSKSHRTMPPQASVTNDLFPEVRQCISHLLRVGSIMLSYRYFLRPDLSRTNSDRATSLHKDVMAFKGGLGGPPHQGNSQILCLLSAPRPHPNSEFVGLMAWYEFSPEGFPACGAQHPRTFALAPSSAHAHHKELGHFHLLQSPHTQKN